MIKIRTTLLTVFVFLTALTITNANENQQGRENLSNQTAVESSNNEADVVENTETAIEDKEKKSSGINNYRRSSISMYLMEEDKMPKKELIITSFLKTPIPDKYNDHSVGDRCFNPIDYKISTADHKAFQAMLTEQQEASKDGEPVKKKRGGFGKFMKGLAATAVVIATDKEPTAMFDSADKEHYEVCAYKFLQENQIPKKMFDKWFLCEEGNFTTELMSQRGLYDATLLDVQTAQSSTRGIASLADAGEELVGNTFAVVSRYRYLSKEELVEEISTTAGAVGSLFGDYGALAAGVGSSALSMSLGAGYYVRITSFLYQLDWNDDISYRFFSELWGNHDKYACSDLFRLKYVGTETAWSNVKASIFTDKPEEELITIATINATDAVLAKLEKKYDVFKTKTPILTTEPLTAAIGLKEGLKAGDKYEVLELREDEKTGKSEYRRVGTVTVSKDQIWDNRYMAAEELALVGQSQEFTATKFDGEKGKYYPGMLLRQIK